MMLLLILKYVPYVGDSKRAMDEYTSEIFMGGQSTIVLHNTCEDSLLAAPIILDLVLLAKLRTRIQLKAEGEVCFFLVLMGLDPPSSCFWIYLSNGMIMMIQRVFNFCRGSSVPSTQLPPSSIPFNSSSHVWDFSDSEAAPASSWSTLPNRSVWFSFPFFLFFVCVVRGCDMWGFCVFQVLVV